MPDTIVTHMPDMGEGHRIEWHVPPDGEPTAFSPKALRSGLTMYIKRYDSDNRLMAARIEGTDDAGNPILLTLAEREIGELLRALGVRR